MEINSDAVTTSNRVNYLDNFERTEEVSSSSGHEMNQALQRLEEQLSLNDDSLKGIFPSDNQDTDMGNLINDPISCAPSAGDSCKATLLLNFFLGFQFRIFHFSS